MAEAQLKAVMADRCNQVCADCGAPKPRFASITLAVFLCDRCYGIHRSLGAHITRTKCVGLDHWSLQEVHRMRCIGNAAAAAYWERECVCSPNLECHVAAAENVPQECERPSARSPNEFVERWIRDKYEKQLFCSSNSAPPNASELEEAPKAGALLKLEPPPAADSLWRPFG